MAFPSQSQQASSDLTQVQSPPQPQGRNQRGVIIALVAAIALVLTAVGVYALWPAKPAATQESAAASTTTTGQPNVAATPGAPSPAAPKVLKLGETKTDAIGKAVVYAYKQPVATKAPRPEQEGFEWGAAEVEVCALADDVYINNSTWHLVYADHTLIEASHIGYQQFPEPSFPWGDKDLAKGRCVRGWITYGVPAGKRPVTIEHDVKDAFTEWSIS